MIRAHRFGRYGVPSFYAVFAACGGVTDSSGGANGPVGHLEVSTSPTAVGVLEGSTAKATVNITRTNYSGAVTLSDSGLPSGVTATYNPTVLSGGTLASTVTFTAASDAPPVTTTVVIKPVVDSKDVNWQPAAIMLSVVRPQVTVTRTGTGTGTVTSSPSGVNCGGTCSAGFAPGTNVTLTATPATGSAFAGWSGAVCTGIGATCSFTITAGVAAEATFNNTAPSFSLAVNPATASVSQGGSSTATAKIIRVNGYAGAVSISALGAPSGMTVTTNPPGVADTTATLNIAATTAVAVGNYPVTISATGAGVPGTQTATLAVQVTPGQGGNGNVTFNFANCDPGEIPIWVAAQNGTGPWTRVSPGANHTFTFAVGATGGIALVRPDGAGFSTTVFYASHDEITSMALGDRCGGLNASTGTKSLTGTAKGVGPSGHITVIVGGASAVNHPLQGSGYTLNNVAAGPRDLIAATFVNDANDNGSLSRLILRRNVNYATSIPLLDFTSTEYFVPSGARIGTGNIGSDQTAVGVSFVTTHGASAAYSSGLGNAFRVQYAGVPDSLLQPGDLHAVTVSAAPTAGTSTRTVILLHHSVVPDSVTFGPALNQPTVTSVGTTPYLRLRAQLTLQSEYNAVANAEFSQSANSVSVTTTAGYLGSTPVIWSIDIPDLSTAGYDASWALKSGSAADWQIVAGGGDVLPLLGAAPFDGARIVAATVSNTSSTSNQLRRSKRR